MVLLLIAHARLLLAASSALAEPTATSTSITGTSTSTYTYVDRLRTTVSHFAPPPLALTRAPEPSPTGPDSPSAGNDSASSSPSRRVTSQIATVPPSASSAAVKLITLAFSLLPLLAPEAVAVALTHIEAILASFPPVAIVESDMITRKRRNNTQSSSSSGPASKTSAGVSVSALRYRILAELADHLADNRQAHSYRVLARWVMEMGRRYIAQE
jgi:hypothetical protein